MKVKQLIYTSWKNGSSTKKGFMVYSQSDGISPDDVNYITRNMRYITLSSLPYAPTWEQIETMFPRNNAYFQLPSGNWCMAQASYLGKDYSGRLGNYIIHAYISSNKPDFNVINLIGSDVYRRSLTEAELEAESNPPALPEVELVSPDASGDATLLKTFFTQEKISNLKYLVAAVMRAVKNDECVYLYDDKDILPLWYKALNFCLPAEILSQVTYATYACVLAGGVTIQSVKPGGAFNYRQQLAGGALVYDFKENAINDSVEVGNFVNKIVEEFAADPQSAKARVEALGTYITEAGEDPDLAIELSWFYDGRYEHFSDTTSLKRMFDVVTQGNRLSSEELARIFGNLIVGNPAYPIAQFPDMYKYILDHGDKNTFFKIVAIYVNLCTSKQIALSSYDAEYDACVKNAPFDWRNYLAHVVMSGGKTAYINKTRAESFPAYLLAVSELDYDNPIDEQLVTTYARTIAHSSDLTLFKKYFARLTAHGLKERVAEKIVNEESLEGGIFAGADYAKSFALLDAISINALTLKTLLNLLTSRFGDQTFMASFSKYVVARPEIYDGIEKAASVNSAAKQYIDSMICDKFLAKIPDEAALDDFYNKYFAASPQMRDVFLQGLENYLYSSNLRDQKSKIHSCLAWFNKLNKWYNGAAYDSNRMISIESVVKNTVFNLDFNAFANVYKSEVNAINEFANGFIARYGVPPCEHLDIIALGTRFAAIDEKHYKTDAFLNQILTNRSIGNYDNKILRSVADNYFDDIFDLFVTLCKNTNEPNWAVDYMDIVILPFAQACGSGYGYNRANGFGDKLVKAINSLNNKELVKCLPVLVNASLACQGISPIGVALDNYFASYKKKKLQSLYDEIIHDNTVKIDKAFKKYMENKIVSAKAGLFDNLFGKKEEESDKKKSKDGNDDKAKKKKNNDDDEPKTKKKK